MYPKDRTIRYLIETRSRTTNFQASTRNTFRAELHRRFHRMALSLVFALIALAVAGDARSHREARIHPLITAITIALFVPLASDSSPSTSLQDHAMVRLAGLCRADRAWRRRDLVHPREPHDGTAGRLGGLGRFGRPVGDADCSKRLWRGYWAAVGQLEGQR